MQGDQLVDRFKGAELFMLAMQPRTMEFMQDFDAVCFSIPCHRHSEAIYQ